MKPIFNFIILTIILFGIYKFRYTNNEHFGYIKNNLNTDSLFIKYKSMIKNDTNMVVCMNCASMALALSYNNEEEIIENYEKLLKYYKEYGYVPCPELICEKDKIKVQTTRAITLKKDSDKNMQSVARIFSKTVIPVE